MGFAYQGRLFGAISAIAIALGSITVTAAEAATIKPGTGLTSGTLMTSASCSGNAADTNVGSFSAGGKKARLNCGGGGGGVVSIAATSAGASIGTKKASRVSWNVDGGGAFQEVSFALKGANSKKRSFFAVQAGDTAWRIASRQKKGEATWIRVVFDEAIETARVTFNTKRKDSFRLADVRVLPWVTGIPGGGIPGGGNPGGGHSGGGHSGGGLTPAPIPLPPAALLLGAGIVALGSLRRRRSAAA